MGTSHISHISQFKDQFFTFTIFATSQRQRADKNELNSERQQNSISESAYCIRIGANEYFNKRPKRAGRLRHGQNGLA